MPNLCSYDKEGRKRQVGTGKVKIPGGQAVVCGCVQTFVYKHNSESQSIIIARKTREASGASLPCEEGEGGAVRASRGQMAGELAYHDLERPPLRFLLNFNFHEGSVN